MQAVIATRFPPKFVVQNGKKPPPDMPTIVHYRKNENDMDDNDDDDDDDEDHDNNEYDDDNSNYNYSKQMKLSSIDMGSINSFIKEQMGSCMDGPKCTFCLRGTNEYPMVCIGWNLDTTSCGYPAIDLYFQECCNGRQMHKATTFFATNMDLIQQILADLKLHRVCCDDNFDNFLQTNNNDNHDNNNQTDNNNESQKNDSHEKNINSKIAKFIPNVKVFFYQYLDHCDVMAAERIRDVLLNCMDLEYLRLEGVNHFEWMQHHGVKDNNNNNKKIAVQILEDAIQNYTANKLKTIQFASTNFGDDEMALLIAAIASSNYIASSLEYFALQINQLCGPFSVNALQGWISQNDCPIRHLDMSWPGTTSKSVRSQLHVDLSLIFDAFSNNHSIEELNLMGIDLTVSEVEALCRVLTTKNCTIKKLIMKGNYAPIPETKEIQVLGQALPRFVSLQYLDLSHIFTLSQESITAIGNGLAGNKSLRHLCLQQVLSSEVADTHLKPIFRALATNSTLKTLDLSSNHLPIDNQGLETLAAALVENSNNTTTALEEIDLFNCQITNEGIQSFAECLPKLKTLRSIDLRKNVIHTVGFEYLVKGMKHNFSVTKLDILSRGAVFKQSDYDELQLYVGMNWNGRRVLGKHLPLSLWPLVLARVKELDSYTKGDMVSTSLYVLLRNEILLTSASIDATECAGSAVSTTTQISGQKRKLDS